MSDDKVTIDMLPIDYRNNQFKDNVDFFKNEDPVLYNFLLSHEVSRFRLFLNPDNSPNIVDTQNITTLYSVHDEKRPLEVVENEVAGMKKEVRIVDEFHEYRSEKLKHNSPIATKLYLKLAQLGEKIFDNYNEVGWEAFRSGNDFAPLVRVFGVGLGYSLSSIIKVKDVRNMVIYEPERDMFYLSMYTFSWRLFYQYFSLGDRHLKLLIDIEPDQASQAVSEFIDSVSPLICTSFFFYREKYQSEKFDEMLRLGVLSDTNLMANAGFGWYEDAAAGLYNSITNFRKNIPLFSGKKVDNFLRIFIVGSGPSLEGAIPYILKHQQDAVIISSGTTIVPLLRNGIVPDFQVLQERHLKGFEKSLDRNILKTIDAIILNVVRNDATELYRDVFMGLKFGEAGASIVDKSYPALEYVNPTVTNTSVAFSAQFGADEVYFFGMDYGALLGSDRMHAKDTIYDDNEEIDNPELRSDFTLPANFGKQVSTDHVFSMSRDNTEFVVQKNQDISWFNVGDGASIEGAAECSYNDLPSSFSAAFNKKDAINEIKSLFDCEYTEHLSLPELKETINQQMVLLYEQIISILEVEPTSREELSDLMKVLFKSMHVNLDEYNHSFIGRWLVGGSVVYYAHNIYLQAVHLDSDTDVADFFGQAKAAFFVYLDDVLNDVNRVVEAALSDDEDYMYEPPETDLF
jgi:hypothetical protein